MSSPNFKVFNPAGEYIACCKHSEDAAALASLSGYGSQVRYGHAKKDTLWTEGSERFPAGESYDGAAAIMLERVDQIRARCHAEMVSHRRTIVEP